MPGDICCMGEFKFDKTINAGNLLTVLIVLGTLIGMYNGIIHRMDLMEQKVDLMWSRFSIELKIDQLDRNSKKE